MSVVLFSCEKEAETSDLEAASSSSSSSTSSSSSSSSSNGTSSGSTPSNSSKFSKSSASSSSGALGDGVTVSGTISGLENSVTLSLNGSNQTFSSRKFTFNHKLDAGAGYVVSFVSTTGNINCNVLQGVGLANRDGSQVAVNCTPKFFGNYICSSHRATNVNVIGNNQYEFRADRGNCFGTTKDFSLLKREVSLELNDSETNARHLSISATGKLAFKEIPARNRDFTKLYFAFEVTNTSPSALCLKFKATAGALLREGSNTIGQFPLKLLGDMFYAKNSFRNNCIPAGETRTAWALAFPSLADNITLENVDSLLIQPNLIELFSVNNSQFFLPSLTPASGVWTSAVKEIAGNEVYSYDMTTGFINDTPAPVQFRFETADLLFFGENGFLIEQVNASVADYLGIDANKLDDADLTLAAAGGTIRLLDEGSYIVPALGTTAYIHGRANRAVVHLNTCSPKACTPDN